MLVEAHLLAGEGAKVAVESEMEGGVVPFHGFKQFPDGDLSGEFLPDLALQGLLGSLSRLDFPAREFPPVLEVTVTPLRGENAVAAANDRGDHFYMLNVFQTIQVQATWRRSTPRWRQRRLRSKS